MTDYDISKNLEIARERIAKASIKSGIDDVTIVGVTKTRSPEHVADLIMSGCTDIGENRVQEWEEKVPLVKKTLESRSFTGSFKSHLVGHLQSNKAKKALQDFDVIQSLDSIKLAKRIDRIASDDGIDSVPCMIQVKMGDEESKFGIEKQQLMRSFEGFLNLKHVRIVGFMLIAPLWAIGEDARPYFHDMNELFRYFKEKEDSRFEMKYLSMGMSSDFDVAVEEGANMVRIGRALFEGFDNL